MPGHQNNFDGPQPDPSPWLVVSHHIKEANKVKPYDPKKSVWVPCLKTGGYLEGLTTEKTAGKVSVLVNGEVKTFKEDLVCQVNPPKFDCTEDMANLTYLGDACILHNSVVRYVNQLIYTYSGNFRLIGHFSLHSSSSRSLLYCHQPLQEVSHLHQEDRRDLCRQEKE